MEKDKLRIYTLEFGLITILSFTLFVSNIYNRTILAILMIICCFITFIFIKKRNTEALQTKKVNLILTIFALIYLIAFYLMGIYFGFYKATITFSMWTLTHHIIPIAIIIIMSEIIRKILLAQNTRYNKIITFTIMVLIDLIVYVDVTTITYSFEKFSEIIGFTFFSSIACNLLFNYISIRYGFKGITIYRIITVLYVYIIPYIPNVYVFFRSILRMIYPYIIYQVIDYSFSNNEYVIAIEDKVKNFIFKIVFGILIATFAMLISCQFKYGILVIGSGSMTGTINKGDAIFFERLEEDDVIDEGQVIIFNKDDLKIVHRVVNVKKINGEIRYTTKGDANANIDEGYITNKDIIGISKFKIIYIGYPSIWLREMFLAKQN